ncbi:DUF3306 domain-containing protein [Shewanella schlegeliana]|uniref:DUF3306 domain-containing protein n=1 Tax=Shewanella schlegeliana TaxID=190308 RepID=A0ABS1T3S1_9GAMM|nr:DUF3306 domain-containing protein [Shewanella schlegeliana]MBL4915448.1 DUF3306 domain-containing protein [Shewanella schlegeliana]MCL1110028.1 DUF3306 domain-containing protein [Shewanella schlegeliana]GIU25158.1 hypothetical protein TUM4433_09590 [Shewanella schlegeliana]
MSGFLSRWNLRKQQVEAEGEAEVAAAEAAQKQAEEQALAAQQQAEAELASQAESTSVADETEVKESADKILTAEDLPDPEKIEVGGSFASFMGANVDPAAKSAALKALWKQPHYSEIDGLLEYALDYSNQPKLAPDVSAELAKKVFRHIVKDEDEEQGDKEEIEAASDEMIAAENSGQNERLNDADSVSDILDAHQDELPQNEPESSDVSNGKVV